MKTGAKHQQNSIFAAAKNGSKNTMIGRRYSKKEQAEIRTRLTAKSISIGHGWIKKAAEEIGTSRTTLSSFVNGASISDDNLDRLVAYLGDEYSAEAVRRGLRGVLGKDFYARAIRQACDAAGVPRWTPHQLRHTAATLAAARYGADASRALLGHASLDATAIYLEKDTARALEIARADG